MVAAPADRLFVSQRRQCPASEPEGTLLRTFTAEVFELSAADARGDNAAAVVVAAVDAEWISAHGMFPLKLADFLLDKLADFFCVGFVVFRIGKLDSEFDGVAALVAVNGFRELLEQAVALRTRERARTLFELVKLCDVHGYLCFC